MKKIINKKNVLVCFFIIISLALMFLSFFSSERYLSIVSLMLLFCTIAFDAVLDIKKKYLLLFFCITFFLFSMGQYIFPNNTDWLYYTNYSLEAIKITTFIQWIALFFTFISFNVFNFYSEKKIDLPKETKRNINPKLFMIALITLFFISAIVNIETGYRVMKYGYLVIYNNSVPSIFPSIVRYIASFFPLMCFVALGIIKEDKYIYTTLILYLVYLCYTLLTGVRGEFGIGILVLIMYLFVHKYIIKNCHIDLKKVFKIGLCFAVIVPIAAIGLNLLNYLRNNEDIKNFNALGQVQSFFVNQGSSVNLISMALENEEFLKSQNTLYVFGPFLENVESKINKIFPSFEFKTLNNKSTSFAADVTIIELGADGYNSGQGLGSQYLAELYIDFGYIGIILFSIILGCVIYILSNFYKYGVIGSSASLLLIQSILYLPRGQAIQPINAIFSVNCWIIIFVVYLLTLKKDRKDQ